MRFVTDSTQKISIFHINYSPVLGNINNFPFLLSQNYTHLSIKMIKYKTLNNNQLILYLLFMGGVRKITIF